MSDGTFTLSPETADAGLSVGCCVASDEGGSVVTGNSNNPVSRVPSRKTGIHYIKNKHIFVSEGR